MKIKKRRTLNDDLFLKKLQRRDAHLNKSKAKSKASVQDLLEALDMHNFGGSIDKMQTTEYRPHTETHLLHPTKFESYAKTILMKNKGVPRMTSRYSSQDKLSLMGKEMPHEKSLNTISYEKHYRSGMPQTVQLRSETERSFGRTFREVQSKVYGKYSSRNLSQYNDSQMASGRDLFSGQSVFGNSMHQKIFGTQQRNWSLEPLEASGTNPKLTPAFRNLAETQ